MARLLVLAHFALLLAHPMPVWASGEAADPTSHALSLLGKHVMIRFEWEGGGSVLESLTVSGTLVRVEDQVLVIDLGPATPSEPQERVIQALERHGRAWREPDAPRLHLRRKHIADLREHPPA